MIVSHERRTLFVHVQKTGGVTAEDLLLGSLPGAERVSGLPGGRHSTLRQARAAMPEVADYWVFGFVRNPWARLYSWHAMILRRRDAAAAGRADLADRIAADRFWSGVVDRYPTFEAFVMSGPDEFDRISRPQVRYLEGPSYSADFVGRTETLREDLRSVAAHLRLELPPAIRRTNAGPQVDYHEHYSTEMRARVAQMYAEDVDRFGYEF